MSEHHQLPPGLLFRSFLIVAGAYVIGLLIYVVSAGLFLSLFVAEAIKPEELKADPAKFLNGPVYWSMFGVNLVVNFFLGWFVARLAPFAQFPHCVFLAVLVFVSNLQQAMAVPQNAKWMYLVFMFVFPIVILLGGNASLGRQARKHEQAEQKLL